MKEVVNLLNKMIAGEFAQLDKVKKCANRKHCNRNGNAKIVWERYATPESFRRHYEAWIPKCQLCGAWLISPLSRRLGFHYEDDRG